MKKSVSIIFLLLFMNVALGQSNTDFSQIYLDDLYKVSSKIRSINPEDNNFKDLEPIGKSIGDADIVLLGEPSHGDGGAIQMKTRLVKYLHEKKGFDVLLFEAELYAIMFGFSDVKLPTDINRIAKENIYTCWSESKVSRELWDYYKAELVKSNPIHLGGIDVRHAGLFSKTKLVENINNLLKTSRYDTTSKTYQRFIKDIEYLLAKEFASKKDSVDSKNFNYELNNIEEVIKFSTIATDKRNLWLIEINNIRNLFGFLIEGKSRDMMMAQNFIFLSKYIFPGKKIMVWSHNNHNVLDVNIYASFSVDFAKQWYENDTYKGFTYFGSDLFREFGKRVYSLAITSGSGNYSPAFFGKDYFHADFTKKATIPTSGKESLERYLEKKKSGILFIPLPIAQGRPSGYPWFSARLLDLTFEAKMDYTSSFNGIIYLDKTLDLNGQ
ncbi:hypothetical protein CMT37_08940 [Elizabethkingia anophelis]|nr:hypothetical protein [Elizabethkingia anophelis]